LARLARLEDWGRQTSAHVEEHHHATSERKQEVHQLLHEPIRSPPTQRTESNALAMLLATEEERRGGKGDGYRSHAPIPLSRSPVSVSKA
jgi:hypothetical protein